MRALEARDARLRAALSSVTVEIAFVDAGAEAVISTSIGALYDHGRHCDQLVEAHGVDECIGSACAWLTGVPIGSLVDSDENRRLTTRAIMMLALYAEKGEPGAIEQLAGSMTENVRTGYVPRLYVRRRSCGAWTAGVSGITIEPARR